MKRTRKGFTLIELLIVITIMAILSAAMAVSGSSASAAAKASTIYNNINAIRTSAIMYQLQRGLGFKESSITADLLKSEVELDLADYNKTDNADNNIKYAIVAGTEAGAGAYVICSFKSDGDFKGIAKALKGYKNVRLDDTTNYTIGAFLYHNTPATKDANLAYDCDFAYPEGNAGGNDGGNDGDNDGDNDGGNDGGNG